MIGFYATRFNTVEIDSTWHYMPSPGTVDAWNARTPAGFTFSAKVPRVITHDRYLEGCESELSIFVSTMSRLGEKLGPLVLQFPYVARGKDPNEYETGADFLERLRRFIPALPREFMWAIEIRNSRWLRPELLDTLTERDISLVFIDYYTMDPLYKIASRPGILTAPFAYIRFLGNHKEMDAAVRKAREGGTRKADWDSIIEDRTGQMRLWVPPIRDLVARDIPTYVYFNNHYAGYAPGSIELFTREFSATAAQKHHHADSHR
jgi:uncharacterized protein YecE (DUF72 family)